MLGLDAFPGDVSIQRKWKKIAKVFYLYRLTSYTVI